MFERRTKLLLLVYHTTTALMSITTHKTLTQMYLLNIKLAR